MSYYESAAEKPEYFYFSKRGDFQTTAHFHGAIEFLFVERGEQEVTVGGERRILRAGEACFAESFCPHSYAPSKDVDAFVLLGERRYFEASFSALSQKQPPRFFRFENFELLKWLYALCRKPCQTPVNAYAVYESTAKLLLAEIAETTVFEEKKKDKQGDLICQILQYANDQPQADLSLRALAKKFGYSHEHLSRILHKYLSENWNGFVNRIRVRLAEQTLRKNTTDSIVKIAFDCGFESVHTFYRAYQKEFGKRPRRN